MIIEGGRPRRAAAATASIKVAELAKVADKSPVVLEPKLKKDKLPAFAASLDDKELLSDVENEKVKDV